MCTHVIVRGKHGNVVIISRTNVASAGSVFNDTRKVKVLSLPETIKKKSTFRTTTSRRRIFARNVDFSFIVSGSERTFTSRVSNVVIRRNFDQGRRKIDDWGEFIFIYSCSQTVKTIDFKRN